MTSFFIENSMLFNLFKLKLVFSLNSLCLLIKISIDIRESVPSDEGVALLFIVRRLNKSMLFNESEDSTVAIF